MGQSVPSQPAGTTSPPAAVPTVDPFAAGVWLSGIGALGFLLCRLVLTRHWKKIKADPKAHPFGAVWTDVLIRLVSYVCLLLLFLGLALVIAKLAGRI